MHRFAIAAALAVLTLAATSAPARADQNLVFTIVGAGHITGPGLDCTRHPGGPVTGDCTDGGTDGPPDCPFPERAEICFPNPGNVSFQAVDGDGFHFTGWSHPQCPNARNPCTVQVGAGQGNQDLT